MRRQGGRPAASLCAKLRFAEAGFAVLEAVHLVAEADHLPRTVEVPRLSKKLPAPYGPWRG